VFVGTVKEVKNNENRVGLTPESVQELVGHGHTVLVETGAGGGIGATDEVYRAAGGEIVETAGEIFDRAEMIVKVKEPQPVERAMLRDGQILYTYLHLAPDPEQTRDLIRSNAVCIAYETVTDAFGGLPLLKPMSQVAGRMSIQAGAGALETAKGGRGVLLGGVPGVLPATVVIIGGGVVGFNAAQMAAGLGADVTILDRSPAVLERLSTHFEARAKTAFASQANLMNSVIAADLVIGAVLVPGAEAPKMVTKDMLGQMKQGGQRRPSTWPMTPVLHRGSRLVVMIKCVTRRLLFLVRYRLPSALWQVASERNGRGVFHLREGEVGRPRCNGRVS